MRYLFLSSPQGIKDVGTHWRDIKEQTGFSNLRVYGCAIGPEERYANAIKETLDLGEECRKSHAALTPALLRLDEINGVVNAEIKSEEFDALALTSGRCIVEEYAPHFTESFNFGELPERAWRNCSTIGFKVKKGKLQVLNF